MFSSGAGYSHIKPMLPLAVAARDAGHDVVFVTGPEAVRYPEEAGLYTVAIGAPPGGSGDNGMWQRARAEMETLSRDERMSHLMAHYMVGMGAAARLDDVLAFVRGWKPDLVVSSLAERAAVMAAAIVDVPYAMHAIGPPKAATTMAEAWRVAGELVRRHGLDRLPPRDDVPYLDIWPAGLRPDGVAWEYPTRWALRPEDALPVTAERPAVLDGLPFARTVYLTLGTTHNTRPGVLETMVSALRDEEVNLVVTIGRDGDRERFGSRPEHVRIEHFVPQQQLLPQVDAVVCHAGAATVLGALGHGVPLVVSPLATDQFDIADQVADAHVGVLAEPTEDDLRLAVRALGADPSLRESAATMAGEIAAMAPPATVLDRLVAYARES